MARLRLYQDSSKIPLCGSMNLSTLAWKDRVISDIQNIYGKAFTYHIPEIKYLFTFIYYTLLNHCHRPERYPAEQNTKAGGDKRLENKIPIVHIRQICAVNLRSRYRAVVVGCCQNLDKVMDFILLTAL